MRLSFVCTLAIAPTLTLSVTAANAQAPPHVEPAATGRPITNVLKGQMEASPGPPSALPPDPPPSSTLTNETAVSPAVSGKSEEPSGPDSTGATAVPGVAPERAARRTTMDDVALSSTQELHFGHAKGRYSLNFFGDLSFSVFVPRGPERQPSFALGAQNFLLRGELSEHLTATTEFSIEFDEGGEAAVDLERLHVRWQEPHFFVEAGRWHTDFGYWNAAYHHGRWLQPTIARPRWVIFEDEGGLLPVHWVGLTAGASTEWGPGSFRGAVAVGNSRGKSVADVRNQNDYYGRKSVQALVEYVGLGLPDLRAGMSGIYGRIPPQPADVRPGLPDVAMDEWIGSLHIAYPSTPVVFIAEAYFIEHDANGHAYRTYGGFTLFGYSIGIVTPYAEISRVVSGGGIDPFFIPDPTLPGAPARNALDLIAGARLDVSDWSALKLEYQYARLRPQGTNHAIVLNWSWGF